ncbi:MAG: ATP-binding protein [Chloroflexota bacterium]
MNQNRNFAVRKRLFLQHLVYRPLVVVLIITLTTLPLFFLRDVLSNSTIALLYLLPVILNTTVFGLWPGLFSGLLAFLVFNYFFLIPYYTFTVHQTQDLTALIVFFFITIVISQLVGRAKQNLAQTRARERELTRLYELSTALASVNAEQEIARTLANHVLTTFSADVVQIYIETMPDKAAWIVQAPVDTEPPSGHPVMIVSLQTARAFLGEIRIWRRVSLDTEREAKMLDNFATQGSIAFERTALSRTETRAKILEESDHFKSVLLSSVSHELRTPLATIKAAVTGLLNNQVVQETQAREDLLAMMDEETDHLNRLVGNLLDMSRIESGALKPNIQWNLLSEIVDGVVARMYRTLQNHAIILDIPDELPLIPVDYVQLEQVFSNLLSNSVKYAPKGSAVHIAANVKEGKDLVVHCINQGPAIHPEDLERIFDKFFRVTHADKVSGTGLGLSICKGIIEAHGGKIWAENRSEGVAFVFTLPLDQPGLLPPVIAEAL